MISRRAKVALIVASTLATLLASSAGIASAATINGDDAPNDLVGTGSSDTISGLGASDRLSGLGRQDTLNGGDGDDILLGGGSSDTLRGAAGNDHFRLDATSDTVECDTGHDFVYATTNYIGPMDVCENFAVTDNLPSWPVRNTDQDPYPNDGYFSDNCPNASNGLQKDSDGDSIGDVCDGDIDGDGRANESDYDPLDPSVQDAPGGTTPRGCTGLQALINSIPAGGTLNLPDGCTYRESFSIPRTMTVVGGPGVVVKGSEVWASSGFTQQPDGDYISTRMVPAVARGGTCEPGTENRCAMAEGAFIDGEYLLQRPDGTATLSDGEFALDSSRHIMLGANPNGKVVEVTERTRWFSTNASGVTIDDVDFAHASGDGSEVNGDNFTYKNGAASFAHNRLMKVSQTTDAHFENAKLLYGGNGPIAGTGANHLQVRNSEIAFNNWEANRTENHAGFKVNGNDNLTVVGNYIHDNVASGVWCDSDCHGGVITDNRIVHNAQNGIHYEVSRGTESNPTLIARNVVIENGHVGDFPRLEGGRRPGIRIAGSQHVLVRDNVLAWNAINILVHGLGPRPDNALVQPFLPTGIRVENNTMLQKDYAFTPRYSLGWTVATDFAGDMFKLTSGNGGADNLYYYATPEGASSTGGRFAWNGAMNTLSAFNTTLGEEGGRYLSVAEKDKLVATYNLPAKPAH